MEMHLKLANYWLIELKIPGTDDFKHGWIPEAQIITSGPGLSQCPSAAPHDTLIFRKVFPLGGPQQWKFQSLPVYQLPLSHSQD
jgi:hypothetical protein